MADLDPALVEKVARAICTEGGEVWDDLYQTPQAAAINHSGVSQQELCAVAIAALLSLGIPVAALNALYRGEAVVVNETTGLPYIESDALKARE